MALILRTLWEKVGKRRMVVLLLLFGKEEELEIIIKLCFFVDFPSKMNPSVENTNKAIFRSCHMT